MDKFGFMLFQLILFECIIVCEIFSQVVYEDDDYIVIKDIVFKVFIYLLVIFKCVIMWVDEIIDLFEMGWLWFKVIEIVCEQVFDYCLVVNCGVGGGQMVFYIYIYILVGWEGGLDSDI